MTRKKVNLPPITPPDPDAVDVWPRVLDAAGGPGAKLNDELWHQTKARVALELAEALSSASTRELVDELKRDDPDDYWSSGVARAACIGVSEEEAVGILTLAAAWEASGATRGALGVALHLSAGELFALGIDTMNRLRADVLPMTMKEAEAFRARHADALDSFLQYQYEQTQTFLCGNLVGAYRGTSVRRGDEGSAVPLVLRPLTSFALDQTTAHGFPGYGDVPEDRYRALVSVAVPAARILSTPVTGMASLIESEVVVLGAQRPGDRVKREITQG